MAMLMMIVITVIFNDYVDNTKAFAQRKCVTYLSEMMSTKCMVKQFVFVYRPKQIPIELRYMKC